MDIISSLNERLTIVEHGICHGGEGEVQKVLNQSPVKLPDDYIEFLRIISGEKNLGVGFEVDHGGKEIYIWSAGLSLEKRLEFDEPTYKEFQDCSWLIGDDLGGLVYFYGVGNEGFGLYRGSAGALDYKFAKKIANSLTDFLVDGVGIDIAITL